MGLPNGAFSIVVPATSKTFMFHQLFNEGGEGFTELLKGENLNQTMLKFSPLCSLHIHTLITSFKHHLKNMFPLITSSC
jgi:hypothetical protein